jgi:hypothetical protein
MPRSADAGPSFTRLTRPVRRVGGHVNDPSPLGSPHPLPRPTGAYPFGSASVPVGAGREILEALAVVWSAQSGRQGLSKAKRRHPRTTAGRLGADPR